MKLNRKAQLSFVSIITWVILVVIGAIFTPMLSEFINETINNTANISGTTVLILKAIIPLFWIGIAVTLLIYISPIRPQQY